MVCLPLIVPISCFIATASAFSSTDARTLSSESSKYTRWNESKGGTFELQTAVNTFQKDATVVEVHAQLHVGDQAYFDFYNSFEFNYDKTAILYELLVDEELLQGTQERRYLRRGTTIQAPLADQKLAFQYGWKSQADVINYDLPRWFHADLTRQEFVRLLDSEHDPSLPLWKQAEQKQSPVPGAALEAATALVVPPLFVQASSPNRRIFTNLFLPGDSLATWLRSLLWITVPSPELSILLLDLSSTWFYFAEKQTTTSSRFSPIGLALLNVLAAGKLNCFRKLVFGQVVVAGHNAAASLDTAGTTSSLLIGKRNDHALGVLEQTLGRNRNKDNVALLYGCNHCPDIHSKLKAEGFVHAGTEWRTAWSVALDEPLEESNKGIRLFFALLLPVYFVVGGSDWTSTMRDLAEAADAADFVSFFLLGALYMVRHVLLYVCLSKLVLDIGDK